MESGYKSLRQSTRTRKRTRTRTQRGREKAAMGTKALRDLFTKKGATLTNGKLAVEIMDEEIAKFEQLMITLHPWDKDGTQIRGKSVQAYYWASEMRRDYLQMRAPYQSPRLSSVQVVPAGQGKRETTVNVTILNERGEQEYTDVPPTGDPESPMKLIEEVARADNPDDKDDEAA